MQQHLHIDVSKTMASLLQEQGLSFVTHTCVLTLSWLAGPCSAEVDLFCFETKSGAGRLAKCLKEQLTEQEKPGYADSKISEACKKDLDKFAIDKASKQQTVKGFLASGGNAGYIFVLME